MNSIFSHKLFPVFILGIVALGIAAIFDFSQTFVLPPSGTPGEPGTTLKQFSSAEDFKAYFAEARMLSQGFYGGARMQTMSFEESVMAPQALDQKTTGDGMGGGGDPERFSGTNVQVAGIDEPDILKTDGKEIYFSQPQYYYFLERGVGSTKGAEVQPSPPLSLEETLIAPLNELRIEDLPNATSIFPPIPTGGIKTIKAFPQQNLALDGTIAKTGNLLLSDNTLVVFADDGTGIYGYDVSNPAIPAERWNMKLQENTYIVTSRLSGATVYLVTQTYVNIAGPCPLKPMRWDEIDVVVPCTKIYYPSTPVSSDSTYTIFALDAKTGAVQDSISFVGAASSSVVYVSPGSLYITYYMPADQMALETDFLQKNADLVPASVLAQIERIGTLQISRPAKEAEFAFILQQWQDGLNQEERQRLHEQIEGRGEEYMRAHFRDMDATNIVKVKLDGLTLEATGKVPGTLLNQFALDEYEDNLRVATTVGEQFWGFSFGGSFRGRTSVNDVYILDSKMGILGSVKDLGLSERMYSVRFIEDKGYVVTFRQIDPFYVLDLSVPSAPRLAGELKIPGYSSYLHPVNKNMILGIGQEEWRVKISLFDVSNPASPREAANYKLEEGWSEILQTQYAFLLDPKHEIFFLPGGGNGYIFSYANGALALSKTVENIQARRAIFIDDYLYIVGDNKIIVLDEQNWQQVNELVLQ